MKMNKTDMIEFKKWLKGHLNAGPVTVTFTKKDGTERVMTCTTNASLVPAVVTENVKPTQESGTEVFTVFDLEAKGWRSFRSDSIKNVSIAIGE